MLSSITKILSRKALRIIIPFCIVAVGCFVYLYAHSFKPTHQLSYGIALGYTLPLMNQNDIVKELDVIKNLGFNEVRFNIDWSAVEPVDNNRFVWGKFDQIMQDVKESNLHSIVTLDRTPLWARPTDCTYSIFCAPANPDDFAKFASEVIQRYKNDNVDAWEIWNEPNIVNFWMPAPNAEQYAQLLKVAYTSIKKQDSSAVVLIGGLSGNANDEGQSYIDGRTFLKSLYADGAKYYFNGVAYHPYTNLSLPNSTNSHNGWLKMYATTPSIRSIMVANGDQSKKVWITEFGVPTDGPGATVSNTSAKQLPAGADHVTLALQAQIAQDAINEAQKINWIQDFDWYTYIDSSDNTNTSGNFYGMLQSNAIPKPVYYVFKKLMQ